MVRKAVCCCGSGSIEVEGEPYINGGCHCDNCRRRTGSAFGWNTYFRDGQVHEKRGEFREYRIGGFNPQTRWSCAGCGSTLFWKSAFLPDHTGIAGGGFSDPPLPEPSVTVSNDKRRPWVRLPEGWATSL